jgi:hypothetical protein
MGNVLNATTKRWLVEEAEGILDKVQNEGGFRDQTSQLRNLVQIAQEETEISVLRNFIRYQTGRKTTQKFWGLIHKDVIRVLEALEKREDLTDADLRKAAIQQFFGYLVRHYVYLDKLARDRKPARTAGGHR